MKAKDEIHYPKEVIDALSRLIQKFQAKHISKQIKELSVASVHNDNLHLMCVTVQLKLKQDSSNQKNIAGSDDEDTDNSWSGSSQNSNIYKKETNSRLLKQNLSPSNGTGLYDKNHSYKHKLISDKKFKRIMNSSQNVRHKQATSKTEYKKKIISNKRSENKRPLSEIKYNYVEKPIYVSTPNVKINSSTSTSYPIESKIITVSDKLYNNPNCRWVKPTKQFVTERFIVNPCDTYRTTNILPSTTISQNFSTSIINSFEKKAAAPPPKLKTSPLKTSCLSFERSNQFLQTINTQLYSRFCSKDPEQSNSQQRISYTSVASCEKTNSPWFPSYLNESYVLEVPPMDKVV